jgi:hypothetical protein
VCTWADLTAVIGFHPNLKPLQRHKGVPGFVRYFSRLRSISSKSVLLPHEAGAVQAAITQPRGDQFCLEHGCSPRCGECSADAVPEPCQPLYRLVTENKANVAIGDPVTPAEHRCRGRDTRSPSGVVCRIPIRRRRRNPPHARTLRCRRGRSSHPALAGLGRTRARDRRDHPYGFVASMLFLLWTAVAGIVLTVRNKEPAVTRTGAGLAEARPG